MKPAINIASNGFNQLPQQAFIHSRVKEQLLEFKGSKQYFIKPGTSDTYGSNDLLVQKDLAATLQLIADKGPDVFYKGEIAEKIVADVAKNGGVLTMESLAAYEALDAEVLQGSYRGHDVYGLWMPSFGAITIEILQILETLPMAEYNEAERASAVYQAIKLAYVDRYRQTSLDTGKILISKEYAKTVAEKINVKIEEPIAFQPNKPEPLAWTVNPGHTTHMTVADKDGMIVSLTQTIGPAMGSKVATPGLGFLYASTLGGYLGPMEPGQRAASHVSPMILTKGGQPFIALGAAGGARIPTAIAQSVSRIIDNNMSPGDALASARVHPSNDGIILEMHDSLAWSKEDLEFLRANGFIIEEQKEVFRFGRVHMVMYDGKKWLGAADPDGEGTAAGPNLN
jgi:gamma-glutamyltranspeptidase/glutathione hydrolase